MPFELVFILSIVGIAFYAVAWFEKRNERKRSELTDKNRSLIRYTNLNLHVLIVVEPTLLNLHTAESAFAPSLKANEKSSGVDKKTRGMRLDAKHS